MKPIREVCVLDVGTGNLGSLRRMLQKVGAQPRLVSSAADLEKAERLILPGVGAFDAGMKRLEQAGVIPALESLTLHRRIPILGICLGMQMLLEGSEEGTRPGLGCIPGTSVRFTFAPDQPFKVPHMGWSRIELAAADPLLASLPEDARFYFAHSFHATGVPKEFVLATARHGKSFPCVLRRGNVCGVQFHPEKSHRFGLRLLECFLSI